MFGQLGKLASVLNNLPKIKADMERLSGRLAQLTAEGDAGAGMVRVKVNGQFKLVSCEIDSQVLNDKQLLEDLMVTAANQAMERVKEIVAEETARIGQDWGAPPGII